LSKYQGEILKYGGALLRRNFGVGICAHLTMSPCHDDDDDDDATLSYHVVENRDGNIL